MRELRLLLGLQQLLGAPDDTGPGLLSARAELDSSFGTALVRLVEIGVALREELPDPARVLRTAACANTELARLAAPKGLEVSEAIGHLGELQRGRLDGGGGDWRDRASSLHLALAFWNLCGVAAELLSGRCSDGQLEEHAADAANYILFATFGSGAWDLAASGEELKASGGRAPRVDLIDSSTFAATPALADLRPTGPGMVPGIGAEERRCVTYEEEPERGSAFLPAPGGVPR